MVVKSEMSDTELNTEVSQTREVATAPAATRACCPASKGPLPPHRVTPSTKMADTALG